MANKIKLTGFGGTAKPVTPRVLLHKDGTPVKIGDEVTDFRGDKDKITGWANNGHNRVYTENGEYFPSVFDLKWAD